jgi:hypothetical protein
MTWTLWQQQRRQTIAVAAAFALGSLFLIVTGMKLASTYAAAVHTCVGQPGGCANLSQTVFQGDNRLFDIVDAVGFLLPFVLGLFWGAPLVTREFEEGTHRLAWTQSITRLRWLAVKLLWVLTAAVLCSGALSALVTWWYGPVNAIQQNRFGSVIFDTQGIVPAAYAVFAVATGVLAGAVLRRTVPAMAVTFAVFGIIRYVIDEYGRPHLLPAQRMTTGIAAAFGNAPAGNGSWTLGTTLAAPGGRSVATPGGKIDPASLPPACRQVFYSDSKLAQCLSAHGYRALVSYQPANRYWPFQWTEAAIYTAAAAVAVVLACWMVARRDA